MSLRLEHIVNARLLKDANTSDLFFGLSNDLAKVVTDEYTKHCSGSISILAAVNENLSFGDIDSVKGLLLVVDNNCDIKINGSTVAISLLKHTNVNYPKASFFINAAISSFNIETAVDLSGFYCAWGD